MDGRTDDFEIFSLVCLDAVIEKRTMSKSRAWVDVVVARSVLPLVSLAVLFDHYASCDLFSNLTAGW